MSTTSFRKTLGIALIGALAVSAPLAAGAQAQERRPTQSQSGQYQDHDRGPQQGHGGQGNYQGQGQGQYQQHGPNRPQTPQSRPSRPGQGHQSWGAGRYRVVATVNLRNGPGVNYRRIGQLWAGRAIDVDRVQNGFLHLRGGGWISGQFARRT